MIAWQIQQGQIVWWGRRRGKYFEESLTSACSISSRSFPSRLALSGHEYFGANLINWALKIPRRGIAAEHDQADQDGLVGPYTPYDKTLIKLFVENRVHYCACCEQWRYPDSALSDLIAYLQQRDQDERQDAGELDVHFPGSVREPGGCPPLQLATAGADSGLR
ncbi:hypothetical protein PRNP1_012979 [Phytophthora ramorum]